MNLERWLLIVFALTCAGCGSSPDHMANKQLDAPDPTPASALVGQQASAKAPVSVQQLWLQSCALCHVDGTGGAPRLGHSDEWAPRLEKGRDVLLRHTLEGFKQMPPLGYCMGCERDDFVAMIEMMTQGVVLNAESDNGKEPTTAETL